MPRPSKIAQSSELIRKLEAQKHEIEMKIADEKRKEREAAEARQRERAQRIIKAILKAGWFDTMSDEEILQKIGLPVATPKRMKTTITAASTPSEAAA